MEWRDTANALRIPRSYGELVIYAGTTEDNMRTVAADLKKVVIRPGSATSLHRHLIAESIFQVIKGTIVLEYGKALDSRVFGPGTTFIIPPGEPHRLTNHSDSEAEILEIEGPAHDRGDKIVVGDSISIEKSQRPLGRFWTRTAEERPPLKICGVASLEAALMCLQYQVDAVGVHAVGHENEFSKIHRWRRWLSVVPVQLSVFLLTYETDYAALCRLGRDSYCDTIQLQGVVTAAHAREIGAFLREHGWKFVKSIGLDVYSDEEILKYLETLQDSVDAVILDSCVRGGSGKIMDWVRAKRIVESSPLPILLAGGLTPSNIQEAVATVRPWGLDIESGSEVHLPLPDGGRVTAKSPERISALVAKLNECWDQAKKGS